MLLANLVSILQPLACHREKIGIVIKDRAERLSGIDIVADFGVDLYAYAIIDLRIHQAAAGAQMHGRMSDRLSINRGDIAGMRSIDLFFRARLRQQREIVNHVRVAALRDQTTNKLIFDNQKLVYRGEYELAEDPRSFFNEEDPAVERLARDFARSLLTNAMEGF